MLKKLKIIALGLVLIASCIMTSNVFASATTEIMVNGLWVNVVRDLGASTDEPDVYTVTSNDSLNSLGLEFIGTGNNFSLEKNDGQWDIKVNYRGYHAFPCPGSFDIEGHTLRVDVNDSDDIIFTVSKSLSDSFLGKIFDEHAPFTLNAISGDEKQISVNRTSVGSYDSYSFSSTNEALELASIIDGTDHINLVKNGPNFYTVSGQYGGHSSVGMDFDKYTIIDYEDIQVTVEVIDSKQFVLSADQEDVERVAQKILDDKRDIMEATIGNDNPYEIPSESNLRNIEVSASVTAPKVKFSTTGNIAEINNEITVNSQNASGMQVVFPADTTITGTGAWDGTMKLPTVLSNPSVPPTPETGIINTVESTIKIGLDSGSLSFDKPVKLMFPDKAGKKIGFVTGGVFTEIINICDNTTAPTLSPNSECKIDDASNLLVFTNHFTEFVTYSQSAAPTGGGGDVEYYLTVSNVNTSVQDNTATITFDVDNPASAVLKYGTTQGEYTHEVAETELKTSHSFNLISLSDGTYYYQIEVDDNNGCEAGYYDGSFIIAETQPATPVVINNGGGAVPSQGDIETTTKIKEKKTYNYNGIITTKPLTEMNKEELLRLFLMLLLKALLAQRGITL